MEWTDEETNRQAKNIMPKDRKGGGGGVGKMSSDKRNNYMYVYLF